MAVADLQVLASGDGYGIVIGLGIGFTFIMIGLTLIQNRYGSHNTFKSTEEFNAASRSVKPGMIAAGIVSSWTHASTLLTSCTLAYSYGVGGGLWYGAVGTFQTFLFAVAAFKIKEKSNTAHTFPEIVLQKHGKIAHVIYTFFGLVTNLINGRALAAGGCGVFSSLTGMNIWAAYWILPAIVTAATIFLGGFWAVWTDQAYWQCEIASQPATAVKGYVLGSFAWYAIPFAMSTTPGLTAAALTGTSVLPVQLSAAQVSAGLVGPAVAIALMGKAGAGLMVVLLFMATSSSTSAESIAASSLITFDIYKAYINPRVSTRSLFWVSIFGLVIYGTLLAAISCIFPSVGISLNWLIKIQGCLLGCGALPMVCILLWDRASTFAVIVSPIIGLISGLTSWMVATKMRSSTINITTTSNVWSSLAGDCVSLGMGAVSIVIFTFLVLNKKKLVAIEPSEEAGSEKRDGMAGKVVEDNAAAEELKPIEGEEYVAEEALTPEEVRSQKRLAWSALITRTLVFVILIPFTLYGTGYISPLSSSSDS